MGIERFNLAALLDFQNFIRPNKSNPDSKTNYFVGLDAQKIYPPIYRHLFLHVSEWEKVWPQR